MHWRLLLCALTTVAATAAGKAEACVFALTAEEVGPKRTPEEMAA